MPVTSRVVTSPFWQRDFDEQIRLARAYIRPDITPESVEIAVRDLIDFDRPRQRFEDQIASLIHGGRAFGQAEVLPFTDSEFLCWLARRRGDSTTRKRR